MGLAAMGVSRSVLIAVGAALLCVGGSMANEACAEGIVVGAGKLAKQYTTFTRGNVTNNERENPGFGFTVAYNGGNKNGHG